MSKSTNDRDKRSRELMIRVNELYEEFEKKELSAQKLKEACEDLDKLRELWLRVPGVTGLDIGYKIKDGVAVIEQPIDWDETEDGEWFKVKVKLRLHVSQKAAKPKDLPAWQVFLPDGDVIEASYQMQPYIGTMPAAAANLQGRLDPVVGGASVGNARYTGTLGLVVWDKTDGRPCILSNWHILASGKRIIPGSPIYQPGPHDGATVQDRVALLKRWLINEKMDAALAELTGDRSYASCAIWEQRPVGRIRGRLEMRLGDKLVKSGRTTKKTSGRIDGLFGAYLVSYGSSTRLLTDQIRIGPDEASLLPNGVSQPGDSGSVWLYKPGGQTSCMPAALHFAGDSSGLGRFALATPLETVAEDLRFSLTPEVLMSQDDLQALLFAAARARAGGQPVGDPIGGGGSQPVGELIGGGGSQPVGELIGGGG